MGAQPPARRRKLVSDQLKSSARAIRRRVARFGTISPRSKRGRLALSAPIAIVRSSIVQGWPLWTCRRRRRKVRIDEPSSRPSIKSLRDAPLTWARRRARTRMYRDTPGLYRCATTELVSSHVNRPAASPAGGPEGHWRPPPQRTASLRRRTALGDPLRGKVAVVTGAGAGI